MYTHCYKLRLRDNLRQAMNNNQRTFTSLLTDLCRVIKEIGHPHSYESNRFLKKVQIQILSLSKGIRIRVSNTGYDFTKEMCTGVVQGVPYIVSNVHTKDSLLSPRAQIIA